MPAREEASVESPSDWEVMQRTAAGDRAAFAIIIDRHQSAVYRQALYWTDRREDAEDVLQETFLAALTNAGEFRGEASVRTWLLRIARNAALRRIGPQRTTSESEMTLEALAVRAGWGAASPETLAQLAEDRAHLDRSLRQLPADEREVLLLRDWEGLDGDSTAQVLGISVAAMKSRLHRARIHLAALLRDRAARVGGHA